MDVEVVGAGKSDLVADFEGNRRVGLALDAVDGGTVARAKVGDGPLHIGAAVDAGVGAGDVLEGADLGYIVAVDAADYGAGLERQGNAEGIGAQACRTVVGGRQGRAGGLLRARRLHGLCGLLRLRRLLRRKR